MGILKKNELACKSLQEISSRPTCRNVAILATLPDIDYIMTTA